MEERRYVVPTDVYSATFSDGRMATLQIDSEDMMIRSVGSAALIRGIGRTGSFGAALDRLTAEYPNIHPDQLAEGAGAHFEILKDHRIVVESQNLPLVELPAYLNTEKLGGSARMVSERDCHRPHIVAMGAITVARVLKQFPVSELMKRHEKTKSRLKPATFEEARSVVDFIENRPGFVAGKACLQNTIASLALLRAKRRYAEWCFGAAPDPARFHTYVAVDGVPVVPEGGVTVTGVYTLMKPPQPLVS